MIGALTGWKAYALAAASGVLLIGAVLWYGSSRYAAGQQAQIDAYRMAELAEWRRQSERLAGLSIMLEDSLTILRDAEPRIIERYTREVVQNPLPAGCRISGGRLQHINAAVDAANAAGQPRRAVPADPGR